MSALFVVLAVISISYQGIRKVGHINDQYLRCKFIYGFNAWFSLRSARIYN